MKLKKAALFISFFLFLGCISCNKKDEASNTEIQSQNEQEVQTISSEISEPDAVSVSAPASEPASTPVEEEQEEAQIDPDNITLEYNLDENTKTQLLNNLQNYYPENRLPQQGKGFSPFSRNYRYVFQDGNYEITDYFPSFTLITPVEIKNDYCKYTYVDGYKDENDEYRKYDFYVKTDSMIFDAVPAFTCNDACVYSSPDEKKKTNETIEKYTFIAWLYSDKESDFIPIKTFSETKISKIKYVKKEDVISNKDEVAILYIYKQFTKIKATNDKEMLNKFCINLNDYLESYARDNQSTKHFLRREYERLIHYSSRYPEKYNENSNEDSNGKEYLECKTTQKQIERLKEKFPPEKYDYYITTEKFIYRAWTSKGQDDSYKDTYRSVYFADYETEWIPKETVLAKLKVSYWNTNIIKGYWYYDEKTKSYKMAQNHSWSINDSLERLSLMDQIQNGNKSEQEKKKLFQQINLIPVKKDTDDNYINPLIDNYRNQYYYTLYNSNNSSRICDIEKYEGTFTVKENTPLLSLPGTLGDELAEFTEETEIIPLKACVVTHSEEDDFWTDLFYVYSEKDGVEGWIPANRIIADGLFYYGEYGEAFGGQSTLLFTREELKPYPPVTHHTYGIMRDKVEKIYSEKPQYVDYYTYDFAVSVSNYMILESISGNEIPVYSNCELTEKIGTLPDYSIVLFGQGFGTEYWKGRGDGGLVNYSVRIVTPDFTGWIPAVDVYSAKSYDILPFLV